MHDVQLQVNGKSYGGWMSVAFTRGIEAISNSYHLDVSERWSGQKVRWPIVEEDACTLVVDGATVLTGFVDRRSHTWNAGDHTLAIEGRDAAGALIDCSAVLDQWEFTNTPVLDLCKQLGAPFGIVFSLQDGLSDPAIGTATSKTNTTTRAGGRPNAVGSAGKSSSLKIGQPATKLVINPGESAFEVIDRVCRMSGLLPVSDGLGGVVLTLAGGQRATTSLVEGTNILASSVTYEAAQRYRKYIVSGQGPGSDENFGANVAAVTGTAQDLNVKRQERQLFIRPEGALTTIAFANRRAGWEAIVRAARAMRLSVTVQGWTQKDGSLWPVNALVDVQHPTLDISGQLLIVETAFALSPAGSMTTLSLARPDAFIPEAVLNVGKTGDAGFRELLG